MKEGRGQGYGSEYKPWKKISEFSSKQSIKRVPGIKTNRIHLLSKLELDHFYLMEWDDSVVDIREHFPILDFVEVMNIAEKLGVTYPVDKRTSFPKILTSSFCITKEVDGKEREIIRTVRYKNSLSNKRVLKELEIERIYYNRLGVDWAIFTEENIPKQLVSNIEDIYIYKDLGDLLEYELKKEKLIKLAQWLKQCVMVEDKPVLDIVTTLGKEFNVNSGVFIYLFKHLLASKQLRIDLHRPIDMRRSLQDKISD